MSSDGTIDRLAATWLSREIGRLAPPSWVVRHLKMILLVAGAVLVLLLVFIGLLQVLVKKRTHSLDQAQQALQQSEEQYRQIFNTANDAVFLLGLDGKILACSERVVELYGYAPDELKERTASALVRPDQLEEWARHLEQLLAHRSHIHEFQHVRKGGEVIHVELSERVIEWKAGRKVIVSCVRDISDRKRTEEALKESQAKLVRAHRMEMAGLMAGQIAHDFNNLLSPMLGLPDLIREDLPSGGQSRRDLDLIHASARRMAEISQQLLTLGRRGSIVQKPLDLNRVVQEALRNFGPRRCNGIQVVEKLDPGLPTVMGGATQLVRAVSNLLWNAVESMGDSGVLTVQTEQVLHETPGGANQPARIRDFARMTVQDTGRGIPEPLLDKIFDPFFTTKKSSRQRGSGLGLSVVQAVVQDHQGFIEVQSAIGKGAAFSIYLPLSGQPVSVDSASATNFRGTERLLIVDDDQLQIDVFSRILSGLGYDVSGALNGEAAVELSRRQPFDLVLLDMVMETGMDGVETFRRLRELNPRQRAVIVSGYAESRRLAEAQRMGVIAILRKPLSRESLARAVRAELDREQAGS
jgi:PAS domain S-box-containing protein